MSTTLPTNTANVAIPDWVSHPKRPVQSKLVRALLLLGMIILPWFLGGYYIYIVSLVLVYTLSTLGLNVMIGWTGQIGLAAAGFFGLGAYATSILNEKGLPWIVALVLVGLFAALIGFVDGFPAVRLFGFFLAIASLAFGDLIMRFIIESDGITGGGGGYPVQLLEFWGANREIALYYLCLLAIVLFMVFVGRVLDLRLGRTMLAVNNIEIATPSMGIAPMLVAKIFDTVRNVLRAQGMTILLVEQNANAALRMSDRAYVLETGNIVLSGTGEELLRDPRVRAAYLGH